MLNTDALFRYVLQGLAVGVTARIVLGDRITQEEILMLSLTAAAAFAVLTTFEPTVAAGAKFGTGMALGAKLIPEGYHDASEGYRDIDEYNQIPVQ